MTMKIKHQRLSLCTVDEGSSAFKYILFAYLYYREESDQSDTSTLQTDLRMFFHS